MPREAFPVTKWLLCVESDTCSEMSARKYVSALCVLIAYFYRKYYVVTPGTPTRKKLHSHFAGAGGSDWSGFGPFCYLRRKRQQLSHGSLVLLAPPTTCLRWLPDSFHGRSLMKSALRALIPSCFVSLQASQRRTSARSKKIFVARGNLLFFLTDYSLTSRVCYHCTTVMLHILSPLKC